MKILIVEDDKKLSDTLKYLIEEQGYFVDTVYNGMDGLYYASNHKYDLILLDVMMPKMNGYDVIKMLRKQKIATPVLMLTAKTNIEDKVIGLDSGADDYMEKPFSPKELLARIRALSRRTGDVIVQDLAFSDISLNIETFSLSCNERSITLSNKEFLILKMLMKNPKTIFSKETLITKVWGIDSDATDNNVEAYISFLRKKLNYIDSNVKIGVVRMAGYKLEEKSND